MSVPTVMDNLFNNGVISQNVFSVYFEPTNQSQVENGELIFGGIDSTKLAEPLTYA
jgi:cathepsin E